MFARSLAAVRRFVATGSSAFLVVTGLSSAQQPQWTRSPVNGDWYATVPQSTFDDGEQLAVQYGGHLAVIRSQADNDWVWSTFQSGWILWIGLGGYNFGFGYPQWQWTTGERLITTGYTNWSGYNVPVGPVIVGYEPNGSWEAFLSIGGGPIGNAILELQSADCDGNGVPDVAEIHETPLLDANGDGVLNACEDCNGNGVLDGLDIQAGTSLDYDGNAMPDECEQAGTPYCFGDGTGHACPCDPGQIGSPGHGCANSSGEGAILSATGVASVTGDDLQLHVANMPNPSSVLFFQGTVQQASGQGSFNGDGLLCVNGPGGNLIRLGIHAGQPGSSSYGAGIGTDPLISVRGMIPAIGGTRYYQAWHRDNTSFCTPAVFNFSNGLGIVWVP